MLVSDKQGEIKMTKNKLIKLAREAYLEVGLPSTGAIIQTLDIRHNLTQEEKDIVWDFLTYEFDPYS
jgi:hypothetical protein